MRPEDREAFNKWLQSQRQNQIPLPYAFEAGIDWATSEGKAHAMLETIKVQQKEISRLRKLKVVYVEVEPRKMKDWRVKNE